MPWQTLAEKQVTDLKGVTSSKTASPVEIDDKFDKLVQQKILDLLKTKPYKYDLLFEKINETLSVNENNFAMVISKLQDNDKLEIVGG